MKKIYSLVLIFFALTSVAQDYDTLLKTIVTNNPDIVAQLPVMNALILIGLSVLLTLIGGFIPAKKANLIDINCQALKIGYDYV